MRQRKKRRTLGARSLFISFLFFPLTLDSLQGRGVYQLHGTSRESAPLPPSYKSTSPRGPACPQSQSPGRFRWAVAQGSSASRPLLSRLFGLFPFSHNPI
ncbi:hypothetical protein J3F83DRAFT_755453 [Trichoderma novae-zelandiae]